MPDVECRRLYHLLRGRQVSPLEFVISQTPSMIAKDLLAASIARWEADDLDHHSLTCLRKRSARYIFRTFDIRSSGSSRESPKYILVNYCLLRLPNLLVTAILGGSHGAGRITNYLVSKPDLE